MKRALQARSWLVSLALSLLSSCAGLRVEDSGGAETGVEFFPAKPYLIVENTKEGAKTSLTSLPDVSRPRYLKHKRGLGSSEFGFTLSNGMLASVNQKTDLRAPELLTSLGSLATGLAALDLSGADRTVVRQSVLEHARQVRDRVVTPLASHGETVVQQMARDIDRHLGDIESAARLRVGDGMDIGRILLESDKEIRASLDALARVAAPLPLLAAQPAALIGLVQASAALEQLLPEIEAMVAEPGSLTLFEIVPREPSGIDFRRVLIPR